MSSAYAESVSPAWSAVGVRNGDEVRPDLRQVVLSAAVCPPFGAAAGRAAVLGALTLYGTS
ncbi:hypothetical protein ACWGKW_22735 [Streptomyces sp. NPDC054766]